jgi:hypothetical protein
METLSSILSSLAVADPIRALLAAFVFGQVLAWTYEVTYQGLSYSRSFNHTIVLACISAATVVLAMGHSLVAGLGLLGVLSMVRFRTTLKSSRDLVFIMGAATVGVSCGVNALTAATCGAVGFSLVALYLHRGSFGSRARFDGVLRFRVPADGKVEPRLSEVMKSHCRRFDTLSVGEVAAGTQIEHAYQVKFWQDGDRQGLIEDLHSEVRAMDVVILMQETGLEY